MQVTVSRVSPVEVSLHVTLPQDRVHAALDRAYLELGKQAQLRGFRKGKVPRTVLRQVFGPQVSGDVLRKLVDETLPGALADNKIEVIGQPRVEPDSAVDDTAAWAYTAVVEVRPEIAPIALDTLTLTRKLYPVAESAVDASLAQKREDNATLRTPEPARPVQATDSATFDLKVTVEGVERPEFAAQGRTVEVGAGLLLKEINETLVGMSVGDSREATVTFPADHGRAELAGKTAVFHITLTGLQEKVLPGLDDEFAKDLGEDTLDALRAKVRAELEKAAKERSDEELRNEAVEALVKGNPVAAPPSLVTQVAQQLRSEFVRNAVMRGDKPEDVVAAVQAEANERVQAGLILTEIARVHGITVNDADLNARMDEIAAESGRAVQRVRAEYRDGQKRDMLIGSVLEDKVVALVLSKATVSETVVEDAPATETTPA